MTDKMNSEVPSGLVSWQPKPFNGNDLIPYELFDDEVIEGIDPMAGRDHVDEKDLILPVLQLLQGTSKAVQDGVEGAEPGRFYHTGSDTVLPEGPLRLIIAHYHKGNALFPKDNDPRYDGLQTCIADDGKIGTVYGICDECRRCLWEKGADAEVPLGAETHHFVALTSFGPCMIRFSRTSFKGGSKLLSQWKGSRKSLFAHPAVITVSPEHRTLKSGKTVKYFVMTLFWQLTEKVPAVLQHVANELQQQVELKYSAGQLKGQGDEEMVDDDLPSFG